MRKLLLFLFLLLPLTIHAQEISLDSIKAMSPKEGLFYALEHEIDMEIERTEKCLRFCLPNRFNDAKS